MARKATGKVIDFYYSAAERAANGEPVASAGAPQPRHVEMLRLRLLEGLTSREIGERISVGQSAVGHLLGLYFGIEGVPPAAKARRAMARHGLGLPIGSLLDEPREGVA